MADQPANVAHFVHNLDVGFELTEVRTGEFGLKPLHRLGRAPRGTPEAVKEEMQDIVKQMLGEVGKRKRDNAQKVQGELTKAWEDDGPATRSLTALMEFYEM
jgi:hypothetical protein